MLFGNSKHLKEWVFLLRDIKWPNACYKEMMHRMIFLEFEVVALWETETMVLICLSLVSPVLPVTLIGVPLPALRFCGSAVGLPFCRTSRRTPWWRKAQSSPTPPSPPPPLSSWSLAPSPASPHAAGARTPRYVLLLIQPHLLGSSLVLHQPQSFYNITSTGKPAVYWIWCT